MEDEDLRHIYDRWSAHLADNVLCDELGYAVGGGQEEARQRVLNDLAQRLGQGALGLIEHVQWLRLIAARNQHYLPWWEQCQQHLLPDVQQALVQLYNDYPGAEARLREAYETQRGLLREQRAALLKSLQAVTGTWTQVASLVGKSRAALGKEVDAVPSFSPFAQVQVPLPGYKVAARGTHNHPAQWTPGARGKLLFVSHTSVDAVRRWYQRLTTHAEEEGFRLVVADLTGRLTGNITPRHLVSELIDGASRREVTAGLPWKPPTLLLVTGAAWRDPTDALTARLIHLAEQAQQGGSDFAVVVHLLPNTWPQMVSRASEAEKAEPWPFALDAPLVVLGPPEDGLCVSIEPHWAGQEPGPARRDTYLGAWRDADGTYGWLRTRASPAGPRAMTRRQARLSRSEKELRASAQQEDEPTGQE